MDGFQYSEPTAPRILLFKYRHQPLSPPTTHICATQMSCPEICHTMEHTLEVVVYHLWPSCREMGIVLYCFASAVKYSCVLGAHDPLHTATNNTAVGSRESYSNTMFDMNPRGCAFGLLWLWSNRAPRTHSTSLLWVLVVLARSSLLVLGEFRVGFHVEDGQASWLIPSRGERGVVDVKELLCGAWRGK